MNMSRSLVCGTALFALVSTGDVVAGAGTGKVQDLQVMSSQNLLVIRVRALPSQAQPACAQWNHNFGKPLSHPATASLLSLLLSAQTAGLPITVYGTGGCVPGTNTEEIRDINLGTSNEGWPEPLR